MPKRKRDRASSAFHEKLLTKRAQVRRELLARDDEEAFELLREDMRIAGGQRSSGHMGKGEPREQYAGRPIPSDEKLSADVAAMSEKRPDLPFTKLCALVGKDHGYSGRRVRRVEAAAEDLKESIQQRWKAYKQRERKA